MKIVSNRALGWLLVVACGVLLGAELLRGTGSIFWMFVAVVGLGLGVAELIGAGKRERRNGPGP